LFYLDDFRRRLASWTASTFVYPDWRFDWAKLLWRRLTAEFAGSAFLAATVIGSGIAAAALSPGETGLELFENAAATAAGLFAIILMFGPVSGGHFNPVVSFVDTLFGGLRWRDAAAYLPAESIEPAVSR
jgi:arsenate reductase